jgi:hypothetical protein
MITFNSQDDRNKNPARGQGPYITGLKIHPTQLSTQRWKNERVTCEQEIYGLRSDRKLGCKKDGKYNPKNTWEIIF